MRTISLIYILLQAGNISLYAQQLAHVIFQFDEAEERGRDVKLDQHIQIAGSFLLTPHVRAEQPQRAHAIGPAQFGQMPLQDSQELYGLRRKLTLCDVGQLHCEQANE